MANPSNFQITRFHGHRNAKINFRSLYLHQMHSPPNSNQEVIFPGNPTTQFGRTAVYNNWPIYDGQGPNAKLVARAIGMQMNANGWSFNSLSMVFEGEMFKGSSLQIMGTTTEKDSEWAIVGGTGEFALAEGIIDRKLPTPIEGGEKQEITIDGICRMKTVLTKLGPWGIEGSSTHDIQGIPQRLESVTVRHGGSIDGISFSYTDKAGQTHASGPFGTNNSGNVTTNVLAPEEYVMEVTGTIDNTYQCLANLQLVTNIKTYGYGSSAGSGTPFSASVPKNAHVVGFFGTSGTRGGKTPWMSSIGVYVVS